MVFLSVPRGPNLDQIEDEPSFWIFFLGDAVICRSDACFPLVRRNRELRKLLDQPVFLAGHLDGTPCHVVDLQPDTQTSGTTIEDAGLIWQDRLAPLQDTEGAEAVHLKTLQMKQLLSATGGNPLWRALATARHLVEWQRTSRYCSACGSALVENPNDMASVCQTCGRSWWPRVTPAVIVAVTDGERILLGHNAAFQRGFYSAFAGFVEPGETLEEACQREVREESGVEISDLRYFASQHWPFPGNLMIAFTARYAGGEVSADGIELTDVRWFTRDDPPPGMPGPGGMGRALYDWFMQGGAR